ACEGARSTRGCSSERGRAGPGPRRKEVRHRLATARASARASYMDHRTKTNTHDPTCDGPRWTAAANAVASLASALTVFGHACSVTQRTLVGVRPVAPQKRANDVPLLSPT